ncbi:MAG: hypothetical protein AVDCRST_MAG11-2512, partial [uncultured Gemmatimonadaceae bacterium]
APPRLPRHARHHARRRPHDGRGDATPAAAPPHAERRVDRAGHAPAGRA